MAVKKIRVLLNSAEFPWLGSFAGRSISDAVDLNSRMPVDWTGGAQNRELGVPQLIFCENVLPTSKGFKSVGYSVRDANILSEEVPGLGLALTESSKFGIATCFELRNPDNTFRLIGFGRINGVYLFDLVRNIWQGSGMALTNNMRIVTVQGVSYMCREDSTYWTWDGSTFTSSSFLLNAVPFTAITGVGSAGNYIIPHTKDTVYWGTSLDIFDLDSVDLGAGNSIPSGLRGAIVAVLPIAGGAIIFTTENMIAMRFTGQNIPKFTFKEIPGSSGIADKESVAGADDAYFAWTSIGLLRVTLDGAAPIASGLYDALISGLVEFWDSTQKKIRLAEIGAPLRVALQYKSNRYLCVSYSVIPDAGPANFTIPLGTSYEYDGVYILDTQFNRWGKLVRPHASVATFPYPVAGGTAPTNAQYDGIAGVSFIASPIISEIDLTAYEAGDVRLAQMDSTDGIPVNPYKNASLCLIGQFGKVSRVTTSWIQEASEGVAVFGHFQLDHNNQVTTQGCELQGKLNSTSVEVTYLASKLGGDRTSTLTAPVIDESETLLRLGGRITGENIDVAVEGGFVLADMMLGLSRHGAR